MKLLVYALLAVVMISTGSAQIVFSQTWTYDDEIPDNDDVGASFSQVLMNLDITTMTAITLTIELIEGWNGDIYAYLAHEDQIAVLMNRVGRDEVNPDGSSSSGILITFDDNAMQDIHTAIPMSGDQVIGTYQPDARTTDPLVVLPSDPRTAMLSVFNGMDANGLWTLYLADQSAGFTSKLKSWTLTIEGIPEPGVPAMLALGLLTLLRRKRSHT